MARKVTLPTTTAGYLSTQHLNNAFSKIENELNNNVLYRQNPSGAPNDMHNDLNMNGYRIVNANIAASSQQLSYSIQDITGSSTLIVDTGYFRFLNSISSTGTVALQLKTEDYVGSVAGDWFEVRQAYTGQITFISDTESTVVGKTTLRTSGQEALVRVTYLGSDKWFVSGDLG